jgi:hypothetical protein
MAGYLEEYGVADARRERIRKRVILAALALLVAGIVLFFVFRNYREKQQVKRLVTALAQKDYQAAYAMWGCTDQKPCPSYNFERFMEDWGDKGPYGPPAAMRIEKAESCETGSIITMRGTGTEAEFYLWVERDDKLTVGFAPWPVCHPIIRVPAAQ